MFLGYNTNGFAHHRLNDAINVLHQLGYNGIAITPDIHHLDPHANNWTEQCEAVGMRLRELHLKVVIESGARFVLDPWEKHQPTLLSPTSEQRAIRREFLQKLAQAAPLLGSTILSFWSGTASDSASAAVCFSRLISEILWLLDQIPDSVRLAFEPEPGMFIERLDQFAELHDRIDDPRFGLTLDVGHLLCTGELTPTDSAAKLVKLLQPWQQKLWNVHLEDMKPGVHDHLMFGEGNMPFYPIFQALHESRYQDGVYIELSRHSHDSVRTARRSQEFLKPFFSPPVEHLP